MFSKMTQALILSGCLLAAGAASADERNMIVPAIAGAVVGAVLVGALSDQGHEHHYRPQYQGYQPQYRPQYQYQPVAYVPVRGDYRRFDGPGPRGGYDRGYDRGYGGGYDRGRGDGRW